MAFISIEVNRQLSADQHHAILALNDECHRYDGVAPLDDDNKIALRTAASSRRHVTHVSSDGDIIGYAQVSRSEGQAQVALAVRPSSRRNGIATAILQRIVNDAALWPTGDDVEVDTDATVTLRGWAHGNLPGAAALAQAWNAESVRELLKMQQRSAPQRDVAERSGVLIETFSPAEHTEELLEVNNVAFSAHPEQGRWTEDHIRERMAEPWFNPEGIFLARDSENNKLLGFHWTKIVEETDGLVGEVYVLAVHPAAQGRGVGRLLTDVGLRYLHGQGVSSVVLYVEADNTPAVSLYESLMFTTAESHVVYSQTK